MTDLPKRAVTRSAKLASLPLGFAGRTAIGFGKRVGGKPAEVVMAEVQQRTAEQMFKVLGELKGGAMKVGQAMSVFEAALPEELAGPYRATLAQLQEAAPALPADRVHAVLAEELGVRWRQKFQSFDDTPAAAASIGQVHRGVWRDGRDVAVKIQYPGAGPALLSDLTQIGRVMRMMGPLTPGLDMKPLVDELRSRMAEELDYHREAQAQRRYAKIFADDPDFFIPQMIAATDHTLVSEWVGGTPLRAIIDEGTPAQRDRAGQLLGPILVLQSGSRPTASCRSAPRKLSIARRRSTRSARLWRSCSTAKGAATLYWSPVAPGDRRQSRRRTRRSSRRTVRASWRRYRCAEATGLPRSPTRADAARDLPLPSRVASRRGHPAGRPSASDRRDEAQPAADVHVHSSRHDGSHGRAVPTGRHHLGPRRVRGVVAGVCCSITPR